MHLHCNNILRHFGVFFPQDGVCDEEYARAVENRRRTSRQVEDIDRSILKRIEEKKLAFQQISSRQGAALRRAKKEAYFQGWMPSHHSSVLNSPSRSVL